jgi:hypothetical protein
MFVWFRIVCELGRTTFASISVLVFFAAFSDIAFAQGTPAPIIVSYDFRTVTDPLPVISTRNFFSSAQHTHIMLFAYNLELRQTPKSGTRHFKQALCMQRRIAPDCIYRQHLLS